MRATVWSGGEISKRMNEIIELICAPKRKLCQLASHIIRIHFGEPLGYCAIRAKQWSHLLCVSLIIVFQDRNLRIIGWGNFVERLTF